MKITREAAEELGLTGLQFDSDGVAEVDVTTLDCELAKRGLKSRETKWGVQVYPEVEA